MKANIYIISGFLGAGKTTLIQKILQEAFIGQKTALIENDFGEIGVDSSLLKSSGVEVKEINAGCICCSLSGDFVKALDELIENFEPQNIIIEPSGVGKLSDIITACTDLCLENRAQLKRAITVVDSKRYRRYFDNFGEFFEDQIKHADTIMLSRSGDSPNQMVEAERFIKELNPQASFFSKVWERIAVEDILSVDIEKKETESAKVTHSHHNDSPGEESVCCHPEHTHQHDEHEHCHHEHGENCHCHHYHGAEEVFETITIKVEQLFTVEEWEQQLANLQTRESGEILRAKGIVPSQSGYVNIQYVAGEFNVTKSEIAGDSLCVIGQNLNKEKLIRQFGKE
ncbi:CobW family GTP-binding protein [Scatolibacter rhodanostii]|uniref:CobW family GTP-binding protein n=1 Tax=Scatolibacter rhodanostii TaxID=2014781 RepID=UPI000C0708FC|nr:GTP-binding protein [Scatolibacter rhodanostii]